MGLPPNLEQLYVAQDVRAYMEEDAIKGYDPNTLIDG
jgi:hypothetical protein